MQAKFAVKRYSNHKISALYHSSPSSHPRYKCIILGDIGRSEIIIYMKYLLDKNFAKPSYIAENLIFVEIFTSAVQYLKS